MEEYFDVKLLKEGNAQEFRKIYEYFMPRINAYFYSKGSSQYLNADIIQQTFIKLWENKKRLNEEIKLSTQIFQIAKTIMIDELRREKSLLRKKQYAFERSKNAIPDYILTHFPMEEKELYYRLNKAIDLLPPVRKSVFLLSREDDLSQKEISTKLSISVKTVNKHIQLALKQIKPYFSFIEMLLLIAIYLLNYR